MYVIEMFVVSVNGELIMSPLRTKGDLLF
jgi:hypothetical protein